MKPSENPLGEGKYYPTETALVNEGCTESRLTGFELDGRYVNL